MFKEYYAFYNEKTDNYTEEIRGSTEDSGEGASYDAVTREYIGYSSTSIIGARIQLRELMNKKVDCMLDVIDNVLAKGKQEVYVLTYNTEQKTLSESIMESTWISGKFEDVVQTNISVDYPTIVVVSPHDFEDARNTLREYFAEEIKLLSEHFQKINELIV